MPNFCPNCGKKLPIPNPNFCPNCGLDLRKEKSYVLSTEESTKEKEVQRAIHELGEKLEECVEKILAAKGYKTKRRVRRVGLSGAHHEIDVLAQKGKVIKVVECKNWRAPVGKKVVEDLYAKLKDLDLKCDGIVASFAGFTEDARNFAEYYGIELWEPDYLKEELFAVSVGRAKEVEFGETIKVENALPLKISFMKAAEIKLQNKDKIAVSGKLSYHPYYVVSYSYYARFKDPTKTVHKFKDEGKVFIDALDGEVLNPPPVKDIVGFARKLKSIISKQKREESKRNKKFIEEIELGLSMRSNYNVKAGENYVVRIFEPSISRRSVAKSATNYIIEKNTRKIEYTPKNQEDELFPETKTITYIPKVKDINIKSVVLVYVPKWEVNYEAFGRTYVREMLAFSGTILEDNIRYCPKHIGLFKKETIAVCEVCGQALCSVHVFQCPICGKWLCEDDGIFCEDCKRIYCKEHPLLKCEICGQPLCDDCKLTCPICGKTYGHKHARTCDNCGKTVCENCATTTGLIRRKTLCKECQKS